MLRDVDRLTGRTFDVLVVGGGICGLAIAYDAAQRGLSVALVERDDFGGASSFNHLRTIHGGLRYLQSLDFRRARESVRERATLARIAPHAVVPTPFVLPLYRSLTAGTLAMRAGFLLDRVVAFDRNAGVPRALRLPAGAIVSRADSAQRFPGLRRRGLTAAAVWHDYITVESDRLTFSYALAADEHGAALANHVDAQSLLVEGKQVRGVRARDRTTARDLEIVARLTINATGGALDRLLEPIGAGTGMPLLTAMNFVTRREAGEAALGGRTPSGRTLFLVPWRGRALLGTWESPHEPAGDGGMPRPDVAPFIDALNQAFPSLDLTPVDITLVHRGVVPAVRGKGGLLQLAGNEQIHDHRKQGREGLISVAATKYTTARAVAARVTDLAFRALHASAVPCRTGSTALPGGGLRDVMLAVAAARQDAPADLPTDAVPHLVAAYGSRYRDILELAATRSEWRTRIADDSPVIGAELVWAVRREMATTLADAVIRRTALGALGLPTDAALESAAAIVAGELAWSESQRRDEIASVRRFYEAATPPRAAVPAAATPRRTDDPGATGP